MKKVRSLFSDKKMPFHMWCYKWMQWDGLMEISRWGGVLQILEEEKNISHSEKYSVAG